jgi:RNA polymerase sigma-70 factor, ECF subfamily
VSATNVPSTGPSTDPIGDSLGMLGSLLYPEGTESLVLETEWLELVKAVSAGDQSALRELYDGTREIVFTLTFRIVKDRLTSEEVVVDVYHDVWRRAATYEASRGSVIGWIANLTRSRAIDRLRRERRIKRVPPDSGKPASVVSGVSADEAAAEERRSALASALKTLTPHERRAIETAYFEDLSYAEVAERLQAPLGTVKTRIRTGLAKLRAVLQRPEHL